MLIVGKLSIPSTLAAIDYLRYTLCTILGVSAINYKWIAGRNELFYTDLLLRLGTFAAVC